MHICYNYKPVEHLSGRALGLVSKRKHLDAIEASIVTPEGLHYRRSEHWPIPGIVELK